MFWLKYWKVPFSFKSRWWVSCQSCVWIWWQPTCCWASSFSQVSCLFTHFYFDIDCLWFGLHLETKQKEHFILLFMSRLQSEMFATDIVNRRGEKTSKQPTAALFIINVVFQTVLFMNLLYRCFGWLYCIFRPLHHCTKEDGSTEWILFANPM